MAITKDKVLAVAENEIGYLEKASEYALDNKTANAGNGNWTKYGRDMDKLDNFYNGKKNGYSWCDIFVDWCFVKAYGVAKAKQLLCQPDKSAGAGCTYSARYYKNAGRWRTSPLPGDQIFFGNGGTMTHTGIVVEVKNGRVYTIEGNTSSTAGVVANGGMVRKKSYAIGYYQIAGYGRPAYDDETKASGKVVIEVNVLQRGNTGSQVKALQALLIGTGYSCGPEGIDGSFGPSTASAVKKFQQAKKLTVDGVVGKKTWNAFF